MQTTSALDQLANELVEILPKHTETEQRIGLALMRRLAKGNPVDPNDVASDVDLPEEQVADTLDGMPGVFGDEDKRVIGYFGLTIVEMGNHRVHLDGHTLSAWCAWDTLIIPELLQRTLEVSSRSPNDDDPISLTATPEGPLNVSPPETVVTFVPPKADFVHNTIQSFCHYVHFFPSPESAATWIASQPDAFAVPIEDAYKLGGVLTQAVFGKVVPARARSTAPATTDAPRDN